MKERISHEGKNYRFCVRLKTDAKFVVFWRLIEFGIGILKITTRLRDEKYRPETGQFVAKVLARCCYGR